MGIEGTNGANRLDGRASGTHRSSNCPSIARHIKAESIDFPSLSRGSRERIARHKRRGEVNGQMLNEFLTQLHVRFSTRGEEGATAAEYGLLIFLIALVIMGGAAALGLSINGLFNTVAGAL